MKLEEQTILIFIKNNEILIIRDRKYSTTITLSKNQKAEAVEMIMKCMPDLKNTNII